MLANLEEKFDEFDAETLVRFVALFDEDGNGVISCGEFALFMRFVISIDWLEVNDPAALARADFEPALHAENAHAHACLRACRGRW